MRCFKGFEIVHHKNPDNEWNEDIVSSYGNTFWVIDGATSVNEERMYPSFNTDAEGFAFILSMAISKFATNPDLPLKEILRNAIQYTKDKSLIGDRKLAGLSLIHI